MKQPDETKKPEAPEPEVSVPEASLPDGTMEDVSGGGDRQPTSNRVYFIPK
ncbi:MAG: hypothetical protein IK082_06560 [Oscillospiraceae bacterium]|nr:hypothetical protein [Oscillospiraceae bacterium]